MFAGMQLAVSSLVMRDAVKDLLDTHDENVIGFWFGMLIAAFLFGAATGGYLLGWLGDRIGRARAMALSILCYSVFSGLTWFVDSPSQLMALRFLTCMGIGGMWPNGIALVSEAWPNISRPILAGAIGAAANVGIMLFAALLCFVYVTPDDWRWVPLVGAIPAILGLFVWFVVPESPRWLALRSQSASDSSDAPRPTGIVDVFRPPILKVTILGILLGTIPLFGGWGSSNWASAWASQVGDKTVDKQADPALKARVSLSRALPGSISSLLGGFLGAFLGRRVFYFGLCAAALFCSQYLFRVLTPDDPEFLLWYGALGFFSGFFFGWLPLCLPELFPTRVRATGAGVSFNFGRIITAFGVLVAGGLLKEWFDGDYAAIGQITSFIYAIGMVIILFAPLRSGEALED
jgi:MFS family permease